jgi:hypothetical protein
LVDTDRQPAAAAVAAVTAVLIKQQLIAAAAAAAAAAVQNLRLQKYTNGKRNKTKSLQQ